MHTQVVYSAPRSLSSPAQSKVYARISHRPGRAMGCANRVTPQLAASRVAVKPEDFPWFDSFYVDSVIKGEYSLRRALLDRGLTPAADDTEKPSSVGTGSYNANCQAIITWAQSLLHISGLLGKEVPVGWKKDIDERETSGHHWLHMWISKGTTDQQLYEGFRRAGAPCTDARVVLESSAEDPQGVGAVAFRTEAEFNAIRTALPRSRKTDWTNHPYRRRSKKRPHIACRVLFWTAEVGLPDAKRPCGATVFRLHRT